MLEIQNMEEIDMEKHMERRNMGTVEKRKMDLDVYLEEKGLNASAHAAVQRIGPEDIAQMLADIVPFAEQDVALKYVRLYLDTFFAVNAKGGGRFSEGLAVCYDCLIPVYPADFAEVEATLPSCLGYREKILSCVLAWQKEYHNQN